jgi:hypothetical protein
VKRLRNNQAVVLQPSSRRGKVDENAVTVTGTAEIISEPAAVERLRAIFQDK